MALERQQQTERQLGHRDRVRRRGVHHHDPPRPRRGHVDVVESGPRARHHLEIRGALEHVRGHLGGAPHQQRRAAGERLDQRRLVETGALDRLVARRAQPGRGAGGEAIGDEDFHASCQAAVAWDMARTAALFAPSP